MAAPNTLDPQLLAQLHSNYLAGQQQVQQKKHSGNFLTHLLPTIGGTGGGIAGGAAGGALAGSAILPGIGTAVGGLAGALLGGFGGGAAGKVVENKVEGNALGSGVVGQGIEQGVLSAGPLKLLKGATLGSKAAIGALKDGEGLTGAINAAGDKAVKPLIGSQAAKTGSSLRGEARGIKPGVTQTGTSSRLKPSQSDDINNYLNNLGTKNSAHTQVRAVADDLKATGQTIADRVKSADRPTTVQELSTITESAGNKAKNALGFKPDDPLLQGVTQQLSKAHNLSDLRNVRSNIDDQLKSFYSKGERNTSTTTATENVLKGYRDGIDKVLTKAIPGFKEANTQYKLGLKAQDLLLKSANPQGLKFFGVQTGLGGEGLQAAKDLTGRTLSKASKPLSGPSNPVSPLGIASRTVPLGLAQAGTASAVPQSSSIDPSLQNDPNAPLSQNPTDLSSAINQTQEASPYSRENLMADLQRDPTNSSKYIDYYNNLQDIYAPADGGKGLNSTSAGVVADTQTGLQSLSDLYDSIGSSSVNGPVVGKLRSLNPFDSSAQSLQQQIAATKQIVGKALEGGVLRAEDEKKYAKILPTLNDTDAVAKAKIQQIYSLISQRLNTYQSSLGGNGGGTDLTNAILSAQGQ